MTSTARRAAGLLLAGVLAAIATTACEDAPREKPEELVIYFCKGTRVSSYNTPTCQRQGPTGMIPCVITPPDCAKSTSIRSMYCDRETACKARQPSVCNAKSQYSYDKTCAQLATARDTCLATWKTQCQGIRNPSGRPAGCVASWRPSSCREDVGPEYAQNNQCKIVCGDQ